MASPLEIVVQPTGAETHFEFSTVIEEQRYKFAFYTNTIVSGWYFDLENDDGTSRIRGVALAVGANLLFPYRHLDFPPGTLYIFDKDLNGNDPDLNAFKEGRAALFYLESS